jgi:hypothetical protein
MAPVKIGIRQGFCRNQQLLRKVELRRIASLGCCVAFSRLLLFVPVDILSARKMQKTMQKEKNFRRNGQTSGMVQ